MEKIEGGLRTKGLCKKIYNLQEIKKKIELAENKEYPLISIITVVFNGEKYLEHTIKSVLSQTYTNIEYIIIDGGSTDKSIRIIQKYADKIDCFVSEHDNGIYHAMNKGIKLSQGELIGIINSDDWYSEIAVELVVKKYLELEERNNVIISGGLRCIDVEKGIEVEIIRKESDLKKYINKTMPINHPATFVSAQTYNTLGKFDEKFIISGDYNFVCRAYHSSSVKFYFCKDIITNMRLGGISTESKNILLIAKENYLVRKEYISMIKNVYYMCRSILINLIKVFLYKFKK